MGANLAVLFKNTFENVSVVAFDSLKRRGSELNLPRLKDGGVTFLHGDIRCREDVDAWPPFDLLVDCSAEPSVQAGINGSPLPVIQSNLAGTVYCMEAARRSGAAFVFLSTSRVYPIERLNTLACREDATRFSWTAGSGPLNPTARSSPRSWTCPNWCFQAPSCLEIYRSSPGREGKASLMW